MRKGLALIAMLLSGVSATAHADTVCEWMDFASKVEATGVEDAIRSMTSLPAQILGLKDRGMLREGYVADVVVLDLPRYESKATFFQPHQYAEGVDHVITNGQFLVDGGKLTWKLPGRLLMTGPRPAR